MALGSTIPLSHDVDAEIVAPISISSAWATVIDAGSEIAADNAGNAITTPNTQVTNSTTHIFDRRAKAGTNIYVRMKYDDGCVPNVDPVIEMFGRHDSTDTWMRLYTVATVQANTATLTTATASDVQDGTLKATEVTRDQTFDCMGCNEILIGVRTAFGVASGVKTNAIVQVKTV